ncbi:MAG: T9SS C-terminal target domain-containing protein, partial [Crocinitomicaceae bacterium]|nr:T9SS C-terminal target domain-containing protein [Crocinitomicaceae bacterium]
DFTGENNVATSTAEVYNANLDASNTITRGAGAVGSAGANSFRTQGFQNNGIALTNTDYFQNQFSAAPGFTLSLTSINARFAGTTSFFANPGVSMQYAYSLDGTNFTLIGSPFSMTAIGAMPAIDLSGVSALQNVAENITVTIRFYASGQTTTGGWGYNSPSSGSYGLAFGGTLNCLVQSTFYADTDNDTFGDVNTTIQACAAPAGYVSNATDCDDTNPAINPNTIWYLDADNDMSGDAANTVTSCTEPTSASYVLNSSDCDDNNPNVDSITTWYLDSDNDGFGNLALTTQNCGQPVGYVANSTDCDDTNNQNNPNATEVFDGVDNNCNTIIDEGFILTTYYEDLDNDGFGGDVSIQSVTNPGAGYVLIGGDCNDNNNAINPNATDILGNGIDEDCSGSDANLPPVVLGIYEFTQPSGCPVTATAVTNQPSIATFSAFSSTGITCQAAGNVYNNNGWNTTATIDLTEYVEFSITANECQSLDLDRIAFNHRCSATGGTPTWYVRSSLDNYATNLGTGLSGNNNNQNLDDTVTLGSAFDAVSNLTFRLYLTGIGTSGATFRFDNVSLYGNSIALPTQTFYADTDNDGFGNLANDSISCTTPIGFVLNNSDCNDADSLINPTTIWFLDADGDLIGGIAQTFVGCTPPTGYVLSNNDCDDSNINITGSTMYYADADNDTYGDFATGALFCTNPGAGYVTNSLDCDDTNNAIFPGATEICDGIDNDCVGGIDNGLTFVTYYVDADLDGFGTGAGQSLCTNPGAGFVTIAGDCNDTDDQINPDSPEVCDGIDNNCAGGIDDGLTFVAYFTDTDDDGFGTGNGQIYCENPGAGFVTVGGDCNDNNNQIYPGATEVLDNSIDENCDGVDGYVGINELTLANFKIVPNPNNGTFNVILSEEVNNATISIQDLNGKTVQTSTFSGLEFQANLTGVTTGVYFVKIQTENSIAVEKVIIK